MTLGDRCEHDLSEDQISFGAGLLDFVQERKKDIELCLTGRNMMISDRLLSQLSATATPLHTTHFYELYNLYYSFM